MTTIAYRDRQIASDGQATCGDRIDQLDMKKVRKINGCLVAGAGRLTSVLQFFEWFQEWSDAQLVQGESPHVKVFVPEGLNDEDFSGLVVFTDGVVFLYEGGRNSYEVTDRGYISIGSGSDYALAAMDAGASAEEAVKVAIKRDIYSGGQVFIEELDPEPEEITREMAEGMEKEELIQLIFGSGEKEEDSDDPLILLQTGRIILNSEAKVVFVNPDTGNNLEEVDLTDEQFDFGNKGFKRIAKSMQRTYLDAVAEELGLTFENSPENKEQLLDLILDHLVSCYTNSGETKVA